MATFLMLGKYSPEAIKGITGERTSKVVDLIEKSGGKVNSMYALLGKYDLAFVTDFPGTSQAMQASVNLAKMTGISVMTFPAVTVEEFDKLVG